MGNKYGILAISPETFMKFRRVVYTKSFNENNGTVHGSLMREAEVAIKNHITVIEKEFEEKKNGR